MRKKYPIRYETHTLEEISNRFFTNLLPENWTAFKPPYDYGIDLQVEIFDGNQATGLELLVQLKASEIGMKAMTETVKLRVSTYNYLNDKLPVTMVVKYVNIEKEAYWIFLKDISEPNQEHETFTVHIPKKNKLSEINWDELRNYINKVTDKKRAAIHAEEQQELKVTMDQSREVAEEKIRIYQYNQKKEYFNSSLEGVDKAENEVETLFDNFNKLANEIRNPESGLYLKVDRIENGIRKILEITNVNYILRIEWFNSLKNSLRLSGV